ncbi:MAG TPA: glycoside hydrolase family 38 C-terminal domain-containing protein [Opitutaceae bacterium]|nr:glycoside hydrolase family 38 C-terminal domain-containing protein [Opitutaceae bacterium]
MLPRSFLSQLVPARIAEALRRVEGLIWTALDSSGIRVEMTRSFAEHRPVSAISGIDFEFTPAAQSHWGPKYSQRWFKITVPRGAAGVARYLQWNDLAEATLYHQGSPYYGLDLAHRHCPLPVGAETFLIEAVCIRTGIWLDGRAEPLAEEGSRYAPPGLFTRNDLAWSVYHDLKVLLDVIEAEAAEHQPAANKALTDLMRFSPPFLRASPLCRRLCARLERALEIFDRDGLAALAEALRAIYAAFPADAAGLKAVLTGHAHIDLVWLWPERVGEFKAVHTWATQAHLLERYPEYRFGFSQPSCYEAIARRAPILHRRVLGLVAAGRWEATGGTYVESDTQLPCGEALLRSVRLGQEGFAAVRGETSKVFWLPDVFGYSGVMPQLLRAFGIESFFTTKLSWSTVNRFPHTSFLWRGYDGSEVAAHVILLHDYNEAVNVKRLREDALHHQQAAVHDEFLVPTGYGDGGGGATEEMCERARRLANLSGAPACGWGSIEGFFDRLKPLAPDLPVVAGELSLEFHRGVFTTHGRLKAAFRALERALQIREAAHCVCGRGAVPQEMWKRLIIAQFHDYIPGSSIWEVYAEGIPELERIAADSIAVAQETLGAAPDHEALFNPLPLPRTWAHGGKAFRLPALGGAPISELATVASLAGTLVVEPARLRSDRVEATFGAAGGLSSLVIDGCPVALEGVGHELAAYPDRPAMFEAWDIDRHALVCAVPASLVGPAQMRSDATSAKLSFAFTIGSSRVVAHYSVTLAEPVLRIEYEIDWRDPEMLLKAIFRTRYRGRDVRYGAPFGSVLRNQLPGYTREEAAWEVPASRWMVVMDDAQSGGLAVITEAKYGFSVRDGIVGVSLLRSALVTEADLHRQIRTTPDRPRYSDLGRQRVQIALGRHAPDLPMESRPAALADLLYTPCLAYRGPAQVSGLREIAGAPTLIPAWAEPIEDGAWILRLHETEGRSGEARVALEPGWKICRASSSHGQPPPHECAWGESELRLAYGPYQIVSVVFRRV